MPCSTPRWTSPATLGLTAVAVIFGIIFFRTESGNPQAFVNFRLFDNRAAAAEALWRDGCTAERLVGAAQLSRYTERGGDGRSARELHAMRDDVY